MASRTRISWTVVPEPSGDLASLVYEFAAPLLQTLGPDPHLMEARAALGVAVTFWNASILASKVWPHRQPKALAQLKKSMRAASSSEAALFQTLSERWQAHCLDPPLVSRWTYDADTSGVAHFECTYELPEGVKLHVPPPSDQRIAIGGRFLDEVRIMMTRTTSIGFPAERHRSVLAADGTVTVYVMMPSALKLFADGDLPPIGDGSVTLLVGGRHFPAMSLTEVSCSGNNSNTDVAVLVFKPTRGVATPLSG